MVYITEYLYPALNSARSDAINCLLFKKLHLKCKDKNICQVFICVMNLMTIKKSLGKIKVRFCEIANIQLWEIPLKEFAQAVLGILCAYTVISVLGSFNNLLLSLPSGLFLALLINCTILCYLSGKTFYDIIACKESIQSHNTARLLLYLIPTINQSLYIGFDIYILVCSINTH